MQILQQLNPGYAALCALPPRIWRTVAPQDYLAHVS